MNDRVREYHAATDHTDLETAIEQAIDQCIRENILKDFLIEQRAEVTKVMTMDYTFEKRLEFQREEAVEEGRKLGEERGIKLGEERGEKNGMQKILHDQIRKKLIKNKSLEQIAEEIEESMDTIRPLYEQIKKEMSDQENR